MTDPRAVTEAMPDPDRLPEPATEVLRDAIVAPMPADGDLACGVFRADGSFCESSRTLYSANRFTATPARPHATFKLPGRHLYAGIGRHHFGHFLLEGLPRLWALQDTAGIESLLIVPMRGIDFEAVFRRRLGALVGLVSRGLPVHLVEDPVQVEELVLPSQGLGHRKWITGTDRFRGFIRTRLAEAIAAEGPEKLYVSRSQLKHAAQKVDQEDRIERLMARSGFTIFHPQNHTIAEQCARYMAARVIVGTDGSAFHLAPFVMRPGTRVGLIQRRRRQGAFDALAAQVRAFVPEVDLVTINPLLQPDPDAPPESDRPPVDFRRLTRRLEAARFL